MKILKRLRNEAILVGVCCLAGYVAYQLLLDNEAKEGIHALADTVKDSYTSITSFVNGQIGTIMDEDLVAQNRQQIRNAWVDLGF